MANEPGSDTKVTNDAQLTDDELTHSELDQLSGGKALSIGGPHKCDSNGGSNDKAGTCDTGATGSSG